MEAGNYVGYTDVAFVEDNLLSVPLLSANIGKANFVALYKWASTQSESQSQISAVTRAQMAREQQEQARALELVEVEQPQVTSPEVLGGVEQPVADAIVQPISGVSSDQTDVSDEDSSVSVHCDRDVSCAGQNLIGGDLGGGQGTVARPSTTADDSVVSPPVAFEAESKLQSEPVDWFTPREGNSFLSGYDVDVREDSSLLEEQGK